MSRMLITRYLSAHFMRLFVMCLASLLAIVYIFDTIELLRRAVKREDVPFSLILEMSLYKLPDVGQVLLPFAVLFAAMGTFWLLARRHELTALRAAGCSAWQFVAPLVLCAMAIGVFHITVIHPLTASMLGKFQDLESDYLGQHKKLVTLSEQGLWLREGMPDGEVILHAGKVDLNNWHLHGIMVLFFDKAGASTLRLDAEKARLDAGEWVFSDVSLHDPNGRLRHEDTHTLPTDLTIADIRDSFSDPGTISFWSMPAFIKTLEETGLEATSMRVYYQGLLAQPLLLAAMILMAATVSMRPPRLHSGLIMMSAGLFGGFFVFFMSSFLKALGGSHQIPAVLAAWAPALIVLLGSVTWLLNTEDG